MSAQPIQIVHTHQLNTQLLKAVETLAKKCKTADGNRIGIYEHLLCQNRPQSINLLAYDAQKLIGFLSVFFFYEHASEIVLMVAPKYRQKGIATQLLQKAQPTLDPYALQQLIFPAPHQLNAEWFRAHHYRYRNTEYEMQAILDNPLPKHNSPLTLRRATAADIPILSAIDQACFKIQHADMTKRFNSLLSQTNYVLYIAYKDGIPVGKVHMYLTPPKARLSDIAIIPRLQGQGLGHELLQHCLHNLQEQKYTHILLNVETDNQRALNLYTRVGFSLLNAQDYWERDITRI